LANSILQYLTDNDRKNIKEFLLHYARFLFGVPESPLYHYTTGENLIKIIESGELWATHISCLNDTTEFTYAVEQVHKRVREKLLTASHSHAPLLKRFDEMLSNPGTEIAPFFVACFSQRKDDLSQWRAYSGGEGGYALQFDPQKLAALGAQEQILLFRVEYNPDIHSRMFDDVVKWSEEFFFSCEGSHRAPNQEAWIEEFLTFWLHQIVFFAPCLKHPKI
jgi:hypothetical protein